MTTRDDRTTSRHATGGAPAHGGVLIQLMATGDDAAGWVDKAPDLPSITISGRTLADLECLAVGAFSPLTGFMGRSDYECVLKEMRLMSGLAWTLPITLSATDEELESFKGQDNIVLKSPAGEILAILHLEEVFPYDRSAEARHVYRTEDLNHPSVAAIAERGEHLLGGRVTVLALPAGRPFESLRLTPALVREELARRGWRTIAGFQTRQPIHRAHEYHTKVALETIDGLLLHPMVSEGKGEDFPATVRMAAYETLLANFYPPGRVLLTAFPATMRYAGPREAVFHAICRKNYGCTHFIVGRDHAGFASYYGSFEAHEIFTEFTTDELGITPLLFDHAFWCGLCDQMTTVKTCPHSPEERIVLSGTEVKRRLSLGESIPKEFTRLPVAEVLRRSLKGEDY
ncbi:MAG TPA: sulfate adenylyltransferase [Actinomycetota bacterium]|jgi:sulfate adenylyltransferase|nr:sulfate adenylyltransferase [Actinomycetota bacterium]